MMDIKRWGLSNQQRRIIEFADGDYVKYTDYEAMCQQLKSVPMKYKRMEHNAQLQAENESLRQQLAKPAVEWISVKDRLPDHIGSVLACGILRGDAWPTVNECYFTHNEWSPVRDTKITKVTHWMPLPAAYDALDK
jgi:hypothetical protein